MRAIDRPAEIAALPDCKLILERGPFSLDDELALMRDERIEALVTKNSGGRATYAKIEAARALGIEVVMLRRPPAPEAVTLDDIDAVMAWIELIERPISAWRQHPGRAPPRAMKRVSLEPMMTSVAMSTRPVSASPSVVSVIFSRRGRPRGRRLPASSTP